MAAIPRDGRVFVAGHAGLVGSAVVERLQEDGFGTILTATRSELDLRDQAAVNRWFAAERPEYVFLVAGTVGGIMANSTRPAEFLYDNMLIHGTVVEASKQVDVRKLLYLGSSCIYPRHAQQPITEDQLLTGPLEPTNEAYALAKITGIKLCEAYRAQYGCNFISAMPTNLYGPGDNFDPVGGHLVPMLMRRFHEAKEAGEPKVEVWGTGSPRRELLHVSDLADACLFLMDHYEGPGFVNVGTGEDIAIRDLAEMLRDIVHPGAELVFDTTKPDGMPRKVLDVSKLHDIGWRHRTGLQEGLLETYRWFVEQDPASVRGLSISAP
ncbi:MAG: GDP-L-fucose synthase [Acidimicrobiia bacterium]|nr:GDP-L-fucose synthase [Acidimicrobiia bacterium]